MGLGMLVKKARELLQTLALAPELVEPFDRILGQLGDKFEGIELESSGNKISSRNVAEIYQFRVDAHLIRHPETIIGLPESILSLSKSDVPVSAFISDGDSAILALWATEDTILGTMLFPKLSDFEG